MPEPAPEGVTLLAADMRELSKDVRELKGAVDGLKHAHQLLMGAAGIVAALLTFAVGYLGMQVHGVDGRVDSLVGAVAEVRGELRSIGDKLDALEDIRAEMKNLASLDRGGQQGLTIPPDRLAPTAGELGPGSFAQTVGVVKSGNVDPGALKSLIIDLTEKRVLRDTIVKGIQQGEETIVEYLAFGFDSPVTANRAHGAKSLIIERVNDFNQFVELALKIGDIYSDTGGGTLFVSSSDTSVLEIATTFGRMGER